MMIKDFILDEDGQSLVEYAMLISLMALVIVSTIVVFRNGISNMYSNVGNKMTLTTG